MNKTQEEIAENVINYLKKHNGIVSSINQLITNDDSFQANAHVVIRGLRELALIEDISSGYTLTIKGYDFISFKRLRINNFINKFKSNISFALNIALAITTIYVSSVNVKLSKKDKNVSERLIKLEGELSLLDAQISCHFHQHEKSPSDTIR